MQVDLVDASSGAQLWGAAYDRKISDVIAVKQAIAREVTEKLKLKLSAKMSAAVQTRYANRGYQFYCAALSWNSDTDDSQPTIRSRHSECSPEKVLTTRRAAFKLRIALTINQPGRKMA